MYFRSLRRSSSVSIPWRATEFGSNLGSASRARPLLASRKARYADPIPQRDSFGFIAVAKSQQACNWTGTRLGHSAARWLQDAGTPGLRTIAGVQARSAL